MPYVPFADRVSQLRPTAVNRVLQEVRRLQAEGRSLVSLMRGTARYPTPAHIVEAARKACATAAQATPTIRANPLCAWRSPPSSSASKGFLRPRPRDPVTDGATLGVSAALGALVESASTVLLPDPIYDAYEAPIALWDSTPTPVPVRTPRRPIRDRSRRFEDCWVDKTDVILLNTPWNPVGTVLTREELDGMMGFAEEHDCLVISDEIYESLVYDGRPARLAGLGIRRRS